MNGVEEYYLASRERLASVEGSEGISLWRNLSERGQLLVAFEYANVEAAERGLLALSDVPLLAESQKADYRPADVLRVIVKGKSGCRIEDSSKPGFLSMSVRISDPGYSEDLQQELDQIFEELSLIPGFCGSVYGYSDYLEEEVIGIVTWDTRKAFEMSIPPSKRPYEVKLYERIY